MFKLSPIEKFIYSVIVTFLVIGVALAFINQSYYEGSYAREDGIVEWLTVYALLLSSGLCFKRVWKLKKQKSILFLFCTLIAALIFLFGAGEEISWGQRIFNIHTTEYFAQNNSQQEMNVHNLVVEGKKINKIIFGTGLGIAVGFYLLILPWLYRSKAAVKNFVDALAIPVAKTHHIVSYALLFGVISLVPSQKRGELLEFGGCFFFYMMIRYSANNEIFND